MPNHQGDQHEHESGSPGSCSLEAIPADRSHLLGRLFASLDSDPEVEEAWGREGDQREAELASGSVNAVSGHQAIARLRARVSRDLHARRARHRRRAGLLYRKCRASDCRSLPDRIRAGGRDAGRISRARYAYDSWSKILPLRVFPYSVIYRDIS